MATVSIAAILFSEILLLKFFASVEINRAGFSNSGAGVSGFVFPGLKPGVIQI